MTSSEYIFLPSSSRLILCATTVCCSSFPLMQTPAWCGLTCRVGLRGGKKHLHLTSLAPGEPNHILNEKKNTALLSAAATNGNMTNLLL